MKNIQIYVFLLRFYAFFHDFNHILRAIRTEKYHKIQKSEEKQSLLARFFQGNKSTSLQGKISQRREEHRECLFFDDNSSRRDEKNAEDACSLMTIALAETRRTQRMLVL